jgi:3-oxoacyl-[acyl-carrier protein] reductase
MRVCVVGGTAALAVPLLDLWLSRGYDVTATHRTSKPLREHPRLTWLHESRFTSFRDVDLLVTLCGTTADGKVQLMRDQDWDDVIDGTLKHVFRAIRGTYLKDGGNVVVVGSVVGSAGAYGAANYAAAKAGLVGLVRSAALEWAARGVCVNLLELGFTELGMGARLPEKVKARVLPTVPLGRFGTAADFVHAVEFLSTTRYMTGGILTLAGGLR